MVLPHFPDEGKVLTATPFVSVGTWLFSSALNSYVTRTSLTLECGAHAH